MAADAIDEAEVPDEAFDAATTLVERAVVRLRSAGDDGELEHVNERVRLLARLDPLDVDLVGAGLMLDPLSRTIDGEPLDEDQVELLLEVTIEDVATATQWQHRATAQIRRLTEATQAYNALVSSFRRDGDR